MARFLIEYYSQALCRKTSFYAVIPNDLRTDLPREETAHTRRPMKTLFLLHGYTGRSECWIPDELLEKYNFAVISPTAENSFYTDGEASGHQYETMVAIELVDYVRKTFHLAMRPEDTYIAGLSMGGYGAIHLGLGHPDRFGRIGAMSSALIIHGVAHMQPGEENGIANYAYYRICFGDPLSEVESREVNPEVQIQKLRAAGKPIPEMWICCGTEDFLIEPNREFHAYLQKEGVAHEYHESPGSHDMTFWSGNIGAILAWMFRDDG